MRTLLFLSLILFTFTLMASEQQKYTTLYQEENIEVRRYEPAIFATVETPGSMFGKKNRNFSKLAGYIFGGNEESTKISMTSPVTMSQDTDSNKMSFMMPDKWTMEALPEPNNNEIRFSRQKGYYAVAITFGGYSDEEKYERNRQELLNFCKKHNLKITGETYLLGYDPPFKIMGRRNEVLIKLDAIPDKWKD